MRYFKLFIRKATIHLEFSCFFTRMDNFIDNIIFLAVHLEARCCTHKESSLTQQYKSNHMQYFNVIGPNLTYTIFLDIYTWSILIPLEQNRMETNLQIFQQQPHTYIQDPVQRSLSPYISYHISEIRRTSSSLPLLCYHCLDNVL